MKHNKFGSYLTKRKENLDIIKKHGTCFTAHCNNKILGGNLYLEDKENIFLAYSASRRFEVNDDTKKFIGDVNRC